MIFYQFFRGIYATYITVGYILQPMLNVQLLQHGCRSWQLFLREQRRVNDLSFNDYLSPFYFLLIEFHYTFFISYKIIPYYAY